MEIVLIKDWKRERGTVKKGKELEVLNSVGRALIKAKIARRKRDGMASLFQKATKNPRTKQEYRKTKNKEE